MGDEMPKCDNQSPFPVDNRYSFAMKYRFYDARCCMVNAHEHRELATIVEEWGVDKSRANVGKSHINFFEMCELFKGVDIVTLISLCCAI